MARKSTIQSRLKAAQLLEQQGDLGAALTAYGKLTASDPLQELAWHRQMVILRKLKKTEQEHQLIGKAIASYQKAVLEMQKDWIQAHSEKVESSRALAKMLGLVDSEGLPISSSEITAKWENRRSLLAKRLKNSKSKPVQQKNSKKQARPK